MDYDPSTLQTEFYNNRRAEDTPDDAFASIPPELRERGSWAVGRLEMPADPKPGQKPNKVPYNPRTGKRARANDPTSCAPYAVAIERLQEQRPDPYDFPMCLISEDSRFVCVDFDGCLNPTTGELDPLVRHIVERHQAYWDVSASGTGTKAIFVGNLPEREAKRWAMATNGVELLGPKHFCAFTGVLAAPPPDSLPPLTDELLRDLAHLASANLLASHMTDENRHVPMGALAGGLLRGSWSDDEVRLFTRHVAIKNGGDVDDQMAFVEGTIAKFHAGEEELTGFPTLAEHVDEKILKKVADWLGIKSQSNSPSHVTVQQIAAQAGGDFAKDESGRLWAYVDGVFVPGGDMMLKARLHRVYDAGGFGDRDWSNGLVNSVVSYVLAGALLLQARPQPALVNLKNGILNLETGEFMPHTPELAGVVQLPIVYDPQATCPQIDAFNREIFPEDVIAAGVPYELVALLMTPTIIKKAILLWGERDNGKSIFGHLLTAFLGETNIASKSLHALEANRFATYALVGKLANICGDLPSSKISDTAIFKQLVGGDAIDVEPKGLNSFRYPQFCRLVFISNWEPDASKVDEAWLERWLPIPFNPTIAPERRKPEHVMRAMVSDPHELSGVLNRAIAVWSQVRERGITVTESMQEFFEGFTAGADPVAAWFDSFFEAAPGEAVAKDLALKLYADDAKHLNLPKMSKVPFSRRLRAHFPDVENVRLPVEPSGRRDWGYGNIRLQSWINDFHSSEPLTLPPLDRSAG